MVIVKTVKLVSNRYHQNIVVQNVESIPTDDCPEVIGAQRVSKLSFEKAQQQIGMQLNGVIITASCERSVIRPPSKEGADDGMYSDSRNVYVEMGDDIRNLSAPINSDDDIICDFLF